MLLLSRLAPFAQGGNRLCFVHPDDPLRCVKVRRPDFPLAALRKKKKFPKNLKPLSSFDDNLEEHRVMRMLDKHVGPALYQHLSHCYGFEETDLGRGLASELIRDASGRISYSLKQYLWEFGPTDSFEKALGEFCAFWTRHAIPSRDLLLHNIVAQRDANGEVSRLVVIDGLGSPGFWPYRWLPGSARRARAARKTVDLRARMRRYLDEIHSGKIPGKLGRLLHDGTGGAVT
jgi:PhoP regulatory network protein YrbL